MSTLPMFASRRERIPFVGRLQGPFVEIGVGKARAAVAAARALAERPVERVLLLGVAGAYRSSDLAVGDLCVVRESVLVDEGVQTDAGFESVEAMGFGAVRFAAPPYAKFDRELAALPSVCANTVSTCTGRDADAAEFAARSGAAIETMESAAVALACEQSGVELVEVRAISNHCGARDQAAWDVEGALNALVEAAVGWDWLG